MKKILQIKMKMEEKEEKKSMKEEIMLSKMNYTYELVRPYLSNYCDKIYRQKQFIFLNLKIIYKLLTKKESINSNLLNEQTEKQKK